MKKALIIAAHPDDEILGCGGTIKKFATKFEFHVLILTGGAEGRYDKEMESLLRQNAQKANELVGTFKVYFENLPNQGLDAIPLTKVIQPIEERIALIKPEILFVHHSGDLNKDHRITYEATMTVSRPLPGQCVKKVYSYSVPSSTEWNFTEGEKVFVPNTFVEISSEIDSKIDAMKCYKSECRPYPHPRSPEAIKAYAHYFGLSVGLEYAEAFKLIRNIRGEL